MLERNLPPAPAPPAHSISSHPAFLCPPTLSVKKYISVGLVPPWSKPKDTPPRPNSPTSNRSSLGSPFSVASDGGAGGGSVVAGHPGSREETERRRRRAGGAADGDSRGVRGGAAASSAASAAGSSSRLPPL